MCSLYTQQCLSFSWFLPSHTAQHLRLARASNDHLIPLFDSSSKAADDEEHNKEQLFARVRMGAYVNGKDLGLESTAQFPIEAEDDILYPGVSLIRSETVSLNFGYQPFSYLPRPSALLRLKG